MVTICILKNGRFGPYIQYEKIDDVIDKITETKKKKKKTKKKKTDNEKNNFKNVSIPKGITLESVEFQIEHNFFVLFQKL